MGTAPLSGCGSGDGSEEKGNDPRIPEDFLPVCASARTACNAALNPPTLTGTYVGTGETTITTNELWNVGSSESFVATISGPTDDVLSGSFEMESFDLVVESAEIRGTGNDFTIYGIDTFDSDDCQLEARVAISGTVDDPETPTHIEGELTLLFTENISGSGCTAEQLDDYPNTGASFAYTATRSM